MVEGGKPHSDNGGKRGVINNEREKNQPLF
jgi:hypothetical protein